MNSNMHVISECVMEETPYDVFLRNIYCQFVTEDVPSRGGVGGGGVGNNRRDNKKQYDTNNNNVSCFTLPSISPYNMQTRNISVEGRYPPSTSLVITHFTLTWDRCFFVSVNIIQTWRQKGQQNVLSYHCVPRDTLQVHLKTASSALLIMRPSYLTLSASSAEHYRQGLKGEGKRLW